jgi:phage FluMu protein Com
MYEINIKDGQKIKCPECGSVYAITNKDETLLRNITLLYEKKSDGTRHVKCKQCKAMVKIT